MHEFETFVYLDMEKTGSTFIMALLRKFGGEQELRNRPHMPVPEKFYSATKFHFISVRNPLELYLSLYSYGCDRRGSVFRRLSGAGKEGLYEPTFGGFQNWLDFILDPENRSFLVGDSDDVYDTDALGLFSFRLFRLSVLNYDKHHHTKESAREAYKYNIAEYVIRHETFSDDLDLLIELLPSMKKGSARYFLRHRKPINTSNRIESDGKILDYRRRTKLREREWLLSEAFGY